MRRDVTKIQVGADILVLGDVAAMHGLSRDLRRRSGACGVLRRMLSDPQAMRQLRAYWAGRSVSQPMSQRSDHDLIDLVESAIENGSLPAMVLPDHGPHLRDHGTVPSGPQSRAVGFRPHSTAVPVAPVVLPLAQRNYPQPVKQSTTRPVNQMTMEEKTWEVVKRAAALLPGAMGAALLGLFTPENIAIAATFAAAIVAANLTPFGLEIDAVILAITFYFIGMAAIESLKDLTSCFFLIATAQSERDLDRAAELLAKFVANVGLAALMAILHERAKRGRSGGGEPGGDPASPRSPNTMNRPRRPLPRDESVPETAPPEPSPKGSGGTPLETKPSPGARPPLRTEVRNGYKYTLDDKGRVLRVEGDLKLNPAQGRNQAAQLKAGGSDRLPTDEGGHYLGRRFDGPTDDFNHFAQDRNFNRSAYKKLENSWQKALKNGSDVRVDINPNYAGDSLRPDGLAVRYTIDGVRHVKRFKNRVGGR